MSEQIANCEQCLQRYNLFRRRKQCHLCGQTFCSKCISKSVSLISSNNSRACTTCLIITNEHTTRDQLTLIRIKHLRAYLIHSKITSINRLESCFEKQDLINLIESRKQQLPDETYVFVERSNGRYNEVPNNDTTTTTTTTMNSNNQQDVQQPTMERNEEVSPPTPVAATTSNESIVETMIDPPTPPAPPPPPPPPKVSSSRKTLNDVTSLESIHNFTVGQLKEILAQNFVSYKGCVEKKELINKVELLYRDKQQQIEFNTSATPEQSDENLCKICMDAHIDCVFLDCGHLCTCVQCGKKLSECPLCRSYIIRVVRVFKS